MQTTLVATLGGRPQKVTFLLDLLLARGETIGQVIPIYISSYRRSQEALQRLEEEFVDDQYLGHPCKLNPFPVRSGHTDIVDVRTAADVEVVRRCIQELLIGLKEKNQQVHIGLSGGRRLMSLIALSAAMQSLSPIDHLWHIHVSDDFSKKTGTESLLHASTGTDVHLLPVPFVPWVSYFPGLTGLLNRTPQEIESAVRGWLEPQDRDHCARVWQVLTHRQQDVLRAFASGLSRQAVARQLNISVATVDTHRDRIIEQCELAWEWQEGVEFNAKFLERKFGPYLAGLQEVS